MIPSSPKVQIHRTQKLVTQKQNPKLVQMIPQSSNLQLFPVNKIKSNNIDHSQLRRGSTGSIQMENKRTVVLTVDKGNDSEVGSGSGMEKVRYYVMETNR